MDGQISSMDHNQADPHDCANEAAGDLDSNLSNSPVENSDTPISWTSGTPSSSATVTIKFLVTNNMAGSIIGRSGQTISDLQEQSAARIKLSQSGDCYPGTSDRVCLVQGKFDEVTKAIHLIMEKLYDLQQQQVEMQAGRYAQQEDHHPDEEGDDDENYDSGDDEGSDESETSTKVLFSIRVLLPAASCGMLIGKAGSNIKSMRDLSSVTTIRLSPRQRESSLSGERVLTIAAHDLQSCLDCTHLVLNGIAAHPDICRYVNATTSYSRSQSSSVVNSRHSRVVSAPSGDNVLPSSSGQITSTSAQPMMQSRSDMTNIQCQSVPPIDIDPQLQQEFQQAFRNDYTPLTASNYLAVGGQTAQQHEPVNELSQSSVAPGLSSHNVNLQPSSHVVGGIETEQPQQNAFSVKISIPDTKIGAVLGKRGKTLAELQNRSNTHIKISQRGVFVPGTNERLVAITGLSAESVKTAQALISQQIADSNSGRPYPSPANLQQGESEDCDQRQQN